MTKQLNVTNDQIISELNESYGAYATTAQVRLWAQAVGYTPSTILNRLADRKCGRGKYNVAVQKLEETFAGRHLGETYHIDIDAKEQVFGVADNDNTIILPLSEFPSWNNYLQRHCHHTR